MFNLKKIKRLQKTIVKHQIHNNKIKEVYNIHLQNFIHPNNLINKLHLIRNQYKN